MSDFAFTGGETETHSIIKSTWDKFVVALFLFSFMFFIYIGTLKQVIIQFIPSNAIIRNIDEAYFIGFLFVSLLSVLFFAKININRPVLFAIFLFLLAGILSTARQFTTLAAWLGFLQILKPFLIFLAFQSFVLSLDSAKKIINRLPLLLIGWVIFSFAYILFFEQFLGINPIPSIATVPDRLGITASRGLFAHVGMLGDLMSVFGIFFFCRWMILRDKWSLILFIIASINILFSLRMRALLVFPISILVVFLLIQFRQIKIKQKHLSLAGIFTLMIFLIGGLMLWVISGELTTRLQNDQSVRRVLLESSVEISLKNYGFGAGYGRFGSPASAIYEYSPLYYEYGLAYLNRATIDDPSYLTDQWWGWIVGETGLIGMVLFLAIFFIIMRQLFQIGVFWVELNPLLSTYAFAVIGIISYVLLFGFAGSFISGPPMSYLVFSLIGLVYSSHYAFKRQLTSPHE